MIRNGNFTEGWNDMPPAPGSLINQEPVGWTLKWLELGEHLYDDPNTEVRGVPECVHKLSTQLPTQEQLGQANALILAGDTTYKIFNANAPFGASLSQTVSGLEPESSVTLIVPIQVHLNGERDIYGAESSVSLNGKGGWVNGHEMGDRQWYRHTIQTTVPESGQVEIIIRVKSKWPLPKDFFIDKVTLNAVASEPDTDTNPDEEQELSRQTISLSANSAANKLRLEIREQQSEQWLLKQSMTETLQGESQLDIVLLSEPMEDLASFDLGAKGVSFMEESVTPATTLDSGQRILGMDVSYAQALTVNFAEAANRGVKYCFIRAGSGKTKKDANYDHNYAEAGQAGMLRGIYYYLYPESAATVGSTADRSPEGQARRFAAMLKSDAELGAVLDVEDKSLTPSDVKRFVDEFQKHDPYGRSIMIYTAAWFWHAGRGFAGSAVEWAANHPLWVAHYTSGTEPIKPTKAFKVSVPQPWQTYTFYQWTAVGGTLIQHTSKDLDLNYFPGSLSALQVWAGTGGRTQQEEKKPSDIKFVTATAGLRMRSEASSQGAIIKTLSWGEPVKILKEGTWAHIQSGADLGFASSDFLSPENPASSGQTVDENTRFSYQSLNFANSIANYDNMKVGQQFTGTWNLHNTGTIAWSGDFKVAYLDKAVTDTVNSARSQMGVAATTRLREITGREQINPGETAVIPLNLIAPTQPGSYAFHWQLLDENGHSFGGVRWLQIGVTGAATSPSTPTETDTQFGMNVNINPGGHSLDVEKLAGLGWVRFVFWASREDKSPEEAYQQRYRHIIQSYANRGIRSLIIVHQDTFGGNAPWEHGGWDTYAKNFGKACGRVAAACSEFGDMVAYQIYNEQDSGFGNDKGNKNHSAIGIEPAHYALVLNSASQAIRAAHPHAKVIFGGLKTGPGNSIRYINEVQKHLGGKLPVDALAYHPYGRFVNLALFNFGTIGKLGDALSMFKQAFPQTPLWITELGVASDKHIPAQHYADIATYIREVVGEVAGNYADLVPVLIWFGWTDLMRNAGINTIDGKPKAHVQDAYLEMKNYGESRAKSVDLFTGVNEATYLSYSSTLSNLNAVQAETQFTSRWRFKNSGSLAWDGNYRLIYTPMGANPNPMTEKTSYKLSELTEKSSIEPGDSVELALNMTAPEEHGRTYYSKWHLCDADGKKFSKLASLYEELTVIPAPLAGTGVRTAKMSFIEDKTIPDNSRLVAGKNFDKQWIVKNTGSRHWGTGFRLVFIQGDLQMARGNATHMVPDAKPNDTVTLTIPMIAPTAHNGLPTNYSSLWRLQDDRGNIFGDPVTAKIVSTTAVSSTPSQNTALARLLNDSSIWYSQLDPRWQHIKLGNGTSTIGSWGCLMTCMAMTLTAFGTPTTPPELNQKAIANDHFTGSAIGFVAPCGIGSLRYRGNATSWPNSNVPQTRPWTGEDPIQRIDTALAEGNIVVTQVDTKPNNSLFDSHNEQHWVIIVQRTADGSDYLIIDPLTKPKHNGTQPRSLMSKYGNPAPSATNETNLRNAIKSTLVYHKPR